MKKEQLLHVLRAGADISGEKSFVIVGNQTILLTSTIVAWAKRRWREVQDKATP